MTRSSLLRVLDGETRTPPPVWLMRQAGRYLPEYRAVRAKAPDFLRFCYSPDLAAEVTLQPIRRFDFDAAIVFADILVVPDALGRKVEFKEGEGPVLERIDTAGIGGLDVAGAAGRLAPVYETLRKVRAALAPEKALIGFAGAPWTVAAYMIEGGGSRDFAAAKTLMWRDPSAFAALMDALERATADYLVAQLEAGADCVQIFDSWAGVLPENEFRRLSIEPAARIVRAVRARKPGARILGFPRAAGAPLGDYAERTGVNAVSLDTAVPDAKAARVQKYCAVQGHLDPILLVAGGEAMRARVREILAAFAGGRHIFNLGHGIVPQTPPEHVAELLRLIRAEAQR